VTVASLESTVERLAAAGVEASKEDARQAFAALRSALSEGSVRASLIVGSCVLAPRRDNARAGNEGDMQMAHRGTRWMGTGHR